MLPQHDLAYPDCFSDFYVQGLYDLTFTCLRDLFPHLFSSVLLSSAVLSVLQHTSFTHNSGLLKCAKCFMATSFHDPLPHPDLCSNVSSLGRMSLTVCLKQCPLPLSLLVPFLFYSVPYTVSLYHFTFCL